MSRHADIGDATPTSCGPRKQGFLSVRCHQETSKRIQMANDFSRPAEAALHPADAAAATGGSWLSPPHCLLKANDNISEAAAAAALGAACCLLTWVKVQS